MDKLNWTFKQQSAQSSMLNLIVAFQFVVVGNKLSANVPRILKGYRWESTPNFIEQYQFGKFGKHSWFWILFRIIILLFWNLFSVSLDTKTAQDKSFFIWDSANIENFPKVEICFERMNIWEDKINFRWPGFRVQTAKVFPDSKSLQLAFCSRANQPKLYWPRDSQLYWIIGLSHYSLHPVPWEMKKYNREKK